MPGRPGTVSLFAASNGFSVLPHPVKSAVMASTTIKTTRFFFIGILLMDKGILVN
jgi:hypothetical protein